MGLSAVRPEPLPKYLNLGSGKDFRADCFNVDVNPAWQPDALIDLSTLRIDDKGLCLDTARFGRVILHRNSFQKILANDVLEHVPDLPGLMTCCLNLLAIGGIFEIQVPYDLSYGAWQDPTHIRAFNERSWLYYTDWFWLVSRLERGALHPRCAQLRSQSVRDGHAPERPTARRSGANPSGH